MNSNFFEGKRVLVTGGTGFIGTNIVRGLLSKNAFVRATYHNKTRFIENEKVEYIHADLTLKEDCQRATEGVDYVIMAAAFVAGAEGMLSSPMQLVTETVILNMRVLEAAYNNKVKKCLFISSGMVYPYSKEPLTEDMGMVGEPFEKYFFGGWSRRFSEVVCRMYAEKLEKKMDVTVVRVDNIYGTYDSFKWKKSHVMPALIRKAVERMDPFEVWGDGKDYKDFIYVEDLVDGILLALEKLSGFEVVNIASGRNVTVNEVIELILKSTEYENAKIVYNINKPMMIPYKVMSIKKAEKLLDFHAKTSLEEGIQKTVTWYKENLETED